MIESENKKSLCKKCHLKSGGERDCPACGERIKYISYSGFHNAKKNNSKCKKCFINEEEKLKRSKRAAGENNPFFGKKHSKETREKLSLKTFNHSEESKKKISKSLIEINKTRVRKSLYDYWREEYGEGVANKKIKENKEKHRQNAIGEKNNMFGKPSPIGSGNGYSGWYKGQYFRSLKELSFIVNIIEKFSLDYISLERKSFQIKYEDPFTGIIRNYYGDYLLFNKYFIEVKPRKLVKSAINQAKFEAARKFCETKNLIFKIVDPSIDARQIFNLYDSGEIKFLERYEVKFKKWREKYETKTSRMRKSRVG